MVRHLDRLDHWLSIQNTSQGDDLPFPKSACGQCSEIAEKQAKKQAFSSIVVHVRYEK
jgi:hypothetical protein